jgi:hypothetical protein
LENHCGFFIARGFALTYNEFAFDVS